MALTNDGAGMVMPVSPMYNGGYGGFGGDWSTWLIVLILFGAFGGGFGGFGGFGGGMGYDFPWLLNGQNGINANTNAGFNQAATQAALGDINTALTAGFGNVQLGIAGVNQAICQTGNGVTAAVTGAQNALSQQMYANEIADLNRSFDAQVANTAGLTNVSQQIATGLCENRAATNDVKYTIATEACNTRAANTANTQAILDKLCQLELDGVKAQVDAKNDRIAELQTQLNMANLAASQTAQTAELRTASATQLNNLVNELRSCPIPAQPVYGSQPIFTCGGSTNGFGCGCGA